MTTPPLPEPFTTLPANGSQTVSISVWASDAMEAYAAQCVAAERAAFPNLEPVIRWLENGGDPLEAAKELRIYAAIRKEPTP